MRTRLFLGAVVGLFLALCAACSGSGSGDVLDQPQGEFMTATVGTGTFRATRVFSSRTVNDLQAPTIDFSGIRDGVDEYVVDFHLEFGLSEGVLGTFSLTYGSTRKYARATGGQCTGRAAFNSSITFTRNDSERVEGTFVIEVESGSVEFGPPDCVLQNGAFSICMTAACRATQWRPTE